MVTVLHYGAICDTKVAFYGSWCSLLYECVDFVHCVICMNVNYDRYSLMVEMMKV